VCIIAASSRATDRRPSTLIFGSPATEWCCGHLCCPTATVVNHLREVIACKNTVAFYRLGLEVLRPKGGRKNGRQVCRAPSRLGALITLRAAMIPAAADAQNATIDRIEAIVERPYTGLQPGLLRAAGRSVHAHLIDLVGRGIVESDGPPGLDAHYRIAHN
jgi:hypothetical protein